MMSPGSTDSQLKNQLASDWMHRGMDLANEKTTSSLEHAVRCFDEAIALRRTLPLEENHFFRYDLSAGWINRGDAMAQLGDGIFLTEAIKSYDEAVSLLKSLPLEENVLYSRRLAITWINRGAALDKRGLPADKWEAVECFREAIEVLNHSSAQAVIDRPVLLAGIWTNLAGALMSSSEGDPEKIRTAARRAIALVEFSERTDVVSAETGLKARHVLCRLAVQDILHKKSLSKLWISEVTDAVDEGMSLALHWKSRGPNTFITLARDIFRFGCRIYGNTQPHFLAEYLMEYLGAEKFDKEIFIDHEVLDAASAAIWEAFDRLQVNGFGFVATSGVEPLLSDIRELREVEEHLKRLRYERIG